MQKSINIQIKIIYLKIRILQQTGDCIHLNLRIYSEKCYHLCVIQSRVESSSDLKCSHCRFQNLPDPCCNPCSTSGPGTRTLTPVWNNYLIWLEWKNSPDRWRSIDLHNFWHKTCQYTETFYEVNCLFMFVFFFFFFIWLGFSFKPTEALNDFTCCYWIFVAILRSQND